MASPSPRFSIDTSLSPSPSPSAGRSAFPFPPHDGLSRQGSSPWFTQRRASNASTASIASVSSIGGSLDSHNRRNGAVREISQNAISTLLQPPIVRTGLLPHTQAQAAATGFKAPTTRDIPPVTLTNVPHIPPETFREYLSRIGPLFESFQRGRVESEQPAWPKKDKERDKTDSFAEELDRTSSRNTSVGPSPSRQSSSSNLSPLDKPKASQRRSSAQLRRNRNEPTPLSTIPNVYFDEDFHLENPRTFDVVSERAEIVRPPPGTLSTEKISNGAPLPPRKALATNAILQEKLSWYMDTVEVHLINNISTASSGFFAALGSLKDLQTEAEESVAKIQSLREDLRKLDNEVALSGLEVAAKRRRRENIHKLRQATGQVQKVVDSVKLADEMVDDGSYDEAADQMERVGRLLCGQQEPGQENQELIDLRPLKALQGLDSGLQELQLRIGTGFAQRFTTILLDDSRQHLQKVPASDTLKRWSRQRGIPPTYMETDDRFRKSLLTALNGLAQAGHTAPATAAYREAINKEMKNLIRKYLPSSSDDDADSMMSTSTRGGKQLSQQEKSSILARNLRALDSEDAEKLLINIYTSVGEALRRVSTQTKVLLDVTSSMHAPEPRSPPKSPNLPTLNEQVQEEAPRLQPRNSMEEELSQALDMSSLLGQAVDTAHTQITRVLKVRNEQTIRLSKNMFLRYFSLNRLFADECEAVSGRGGNVLRGIINAQISGFVQILGTSETERIAKALDEDSWNAEDFTDEYEALLQRVLKSMTSDPPEWSSGARPIWEESHSPTEANGKPLSPSTNGTTTTTAAATAAKKEIKPAYIDETRYILVPSVLSLLPTINSFLSLTSTLPSLTPQISTSLLEVLRTFNSRSCQLILGAGATRSAGLKNITTKHLALASQALSFITALIPYMRECVRRHIASGQAGTVLSEFDKTKRLYHDHQVEIQDKLVQIMTSRSQAHVKSFTATNLDTSAAAAVATAADDAKASPYMETLTKETLTLHRVLSRHLDAGDVNHIMSEIFKAYREQWTKAFGDAEVKTAAGEKKLLRDVEVMEARLGRMEGFAAIAREIGAVVRAKVSVGETGMEEKKKTKEVDGGGAGSQEKPKESAKGEDEGKK